MRQDCRMLRQINVERVRGYHCGNYDKYLVFVSDRPTATNDRYELPDGSLPAVYGIELETEGWGITDSTIYANVLKSICFQHFHKDLWKIERDGSLNGGDVSAECISQPMTKAYIRNHYRDFKAMFEYFEQFGISPSRSGQCGQHCHISLTCFGRTKATQDEAIRKLYYIVNKHHALICALLYRSPRHVGWCGQMDYTVSWTMDLTTMSASHNNSFNGSHYNNGNIELRVPGGQKDFPCFRNTMESIFHLVDICKTISRKDCDDVTKIFAGCNNYVYDRLRSYCLERGTITTDQLAIIRQTVKRVQYV